MPFIWAQGGKLQLGNVDAASPSAQTLGVQNVIAGTAATNGQPWTFKDSAGTYTGADGGYVWDTAPAAIADSAHTITAFTGSASPYTVTATGAPAYPVGTQITIASATPSSLNGQYTVTSSSSGQFTATTSQTGSWSSGGTAVINPTAQNPYFQAMALVKGLVVGVSGTDEGAGTVNALNGLYDGGNRVATLASPAFTGHVSYTGSSPAVSSCGSGAAIDSKATDNSGTVTVGSVATSCTITFATAYSTWNHCRVTSQSSISGLAYTYSKTAITISASVLGGDLVDYNCDGQ
jgi:hypothetical protein